MQEKLAALAKATNNELYDPEYQGGVWMTRHVETRETLANWEASCKLWAERTATQRGEIAGMPFLAWRVAQARKGQPRDPMSVIDFGDVRIALPGTDLTVFL